MTTQFLVGSLCFGYLTIKCPQLLVQDRQKGFPGLDLVVEYVQFDQGILGCRLCLAQFPGGGLYPFQRCLALLLKVSEAFTGLGPQTGNQQTGQQDNKHPFHNIS